MAGVLCERVELPSLCDQNGKAGQLQEERRVDKKNWVGVFTLGQAYSRISAI